MFGGDFYKEVTLESAGSAGNMFHINVQMIQVRASHSTCTVWSCVVAVNYVQTLD